MLNTATDTEKEGSFTDLKVGEEIRQKYFAKTCKHPKSFPRFVNEQGIPYIRLNGKRRLYSERAVEEWLESRTVGRRAR